MAIGDSTGLKAVQELNANTLPEVDRILQRANAQFKDQINNAIDRLNGATIKLTSGEGANEKVLYALTLKVPDRS